MVMTETAILGTVVTVLWGVGLALIATVWSMLQGRIKTLEDSENVLNVQNTRQETDIARLDARMSAQEAAHTQHREDISNRLDRLEGKIDQLLRSHS